MSTQAIFDLNDDGVLVAVNGEQWPVGVQPFTLQIRPNGISAFTAGWLLRKFITPARHVAPERPDDVSETAIPATVPVPSLSRGMERHDIRATFHPPTDEVLEEFRRSARVALAVRHGGHTTALASDAGARALRVVRGLWYVQL